MRKPPTRQREGSQTRSLWAKDSGSMWKHTTLSMMPAVKATSAATALGFSRRSSTASSPPRARPPTPIRAVSSTI